jgi:hypothetical protein
VPWESPVEASPGDTLGLAFEFKSNASQVAEGIYIDDVSLACTAPGRLEASGVPDRDSAAGIELSCRVSPNPAHQAVRFEFSKVEAGATLDIFDVRGRCVATLAKPAGCPSLTWDLCSGAGSGVAPGIYVARIRGARYTLPQKVVVLK